MSAQDKAVGSAVAGETSETLRFHAMDQALWQEALARLRRALAFHHLQQFVSPASLILHDLLDSVVRAMHLRVFQRILESEVGIFGDDDSQLEALYRTEIAEHGDQNLARVCRSEDVCVSIDFPREIGVEAAVFRLAVPSVWDSTLCRSERLIEALGLQLRVANEADVCSIELGKTTQGKATLPAPDLLDASTSAFSLQQIFDQLDYGLIQFSATGEVIAVSPSMLSRLHLAQTDASVAELMQAIPLSFHNDVTWGQALVEGNGRFENYRIRLQLPNTMDGSILFNVSGFRQADGSIHSLWQAVAQGEGEAKLAEGSMLSEARVRNITRIYVPQLVEQKARDAVRLGKTSLTNEERKIAVLFCDIVGFTAYSETYADSESIITTLNTILRRVSVSVKNNAGSIDKFMGDCIMALFDDPVAAVLAALDMQSHSSDINDLRLRAGQQTLTLRVGIHWGNAVIGNVGTAERLDWTAIGDVVNTASRIEKACQPGAILISHELRREVEAARPGYFVFSKVFGLQVKGKRDELAVCQVDGIATG